MLQAPQRDAGGDAAGAEEMAEQQRQRDRDHEALQRREQRRQRVLARKERRRQRLHQHMRGQGERQPHQRVRGRRACRLR